MNDAAHLGSSLSRREWIKTTAGVLAAAPFVSGRELQAAAIKPQTRVITHGPKHHWFGYYDKWEFDPTNRYVLGMEVDFEHRSPRPDDVIKIGMVDLQDGDKWTELGQSTAWGWQQGCMLQWVPGTEATIIWNDRENGQYVSRLLDVQTGEQRTIPSPVYTVSADGKTAVTADFRRINDVRPGYGYVGFADPHADDLAPEDAGITRVDLETGETELIISLKDIAEMGIIPRKEPGIKHYFNHLLFSPDGSRFIFLHRWQYPKGNRLTRMFTASPDGSDIRTIDDNGLTSHFIWRDPQHILAFSEQQPHGRGFFLLEDRQGGEVTPVGNELMKQDGHCTYLPGAEWILNDTYPDKERNQMPYLYHVETERVVELGHFHSPKEYTGEWRCDTHPRFSRDGKLIVIDSPHENEGRQLHLIDISEIVG
ncbi:MAG: hypothetical protein KDA86_13145 [Planctomycetaceae bacterium]|nr:hypothetical protein [Planctomycetaceae bacterium]